MPVTKPTLDYDIAQLSLKIWERYELTSPSKRLLIGISGIPGAGKSTLAANMASNLNEINRRKHGTAALDIAVAVSMDGFHYSRAHLAAMPNPEEAIHRRGAAFTFDAEQFHQLVAKLAEPVAATSVPIYAPSFDHAVKDPVADGIAIPASARVVFLEGNYTSLNREPWRSAALLMDERWFVSLDEGVARERLAKRHVESGIVPGIEAAYQRIDSTDSLNAKDILENLLDVDEVISGGL